ncbi:E3 ubiquitin-protein ligase siah-1-like [Periplaneta americana]|uniref:E3 ubiquitin-protein ligase siah-1-like n=1 Tax=Periplaneta americana TaxID=6978 RepID=UPI0037E7CF5C
MRNSNSLRLGERPSTSQEPADGFQEMRLRSRKRSDVTERAGRSKIVKSSCFEGESQQRSNKPPKRRTRPSSSAQRHPLEEEVQQSSCTHAGVRARAKRSGNRTQSQSREDGESREGSNVKPSASTQTQSFEGEIDGRRRKHARLKIKIKRCTFKQPPSGEDGGSLQRSNMLAELNLRPSTSTQTQPLEKKSQQRSNMAAEANIRPSTSTHTESLEEETEGRSRKRARAKCSRKTQSQSGEGERQVGSNMAAEVNVRPSASIQTQYLEEDIQQRNNMSTEMNITPSTSAQTEPVEEEIQEIDSIPPAKMKVEPSTRAQAVSLEREIQEINNMSPAEVEVKPSTSAQAESLEREIQERNNMPPAEVNVEPSTSAQAVSVEREVRRTSTASAHTRPSLQHRRTQTSPRAEGNAVVPAASAYYTRKIMSELECPVCFNYMHPPIKTCQNGHCICNNCKRNVIVCPVCRGKFLSVRNVVFENIANHFLSFDRPTAPFFCPLHDVNRFRCRWEGSLPELRDHIRETHLREYIECGDGNVDINISAGKVTLHSTVMLTMGEMFYIHISLSMNKLHGYVQHIGDDNSPEYKYRLCIVKPGCEDEINVTFSVSKFGESRYNIVRSGLCLYVEGNAMQNFIVNNRLHFRVKIFKP